MKDELSEETKDQFLERAFEAIAIALEATAELQRQTSDITGKAFTQVAATATDTTAANAFAASFQNNDRIQQRLVSLATTARTAATLLAAGDHDAGNVMRRLLDDQPLAELQALLRAAFEGKPLSPAMLEIPADSAADDDDVFF